MQGIVVSIINRVLGISKLKTYIKNEYIRYTVWIRYCTVFYLLLPIREFVVKAKNKQKKNNNPLVHAPNGPFSLFYYF